MNVDVHSAHLQAAEQPLLHGAAAVQLSDDWRSDDTATKVWALRRIAHQVFKGDGAIGQLCYMKIMDKEKPELQVVPYYLPSYMDYPVLRSVSFIWQQLRVVLNTIFGSNIEPTPRDWPKELEEATGQYTGRGALVDPAVIERQLVWEEEHANVLYNYRPIRSESQLHLLVTAKPDAPAQDFGELNQDQYKAVWRVAHTVHDKALEIWPNRRVETHVFDKSGSFAGQTQPVYHAHVVVILDKADSRWAKLSLLWRMAWTSSPLGDEQLQSVIELQRERFAPVMGTDFAGG